MKIQLTTSALDELIASGGGVDFRLNQPVWKDIHEGSEILFWEDFTGWQTEPSENSRVGLLRLSLNVCNAPDDVTFVNQSNAGAVIRTVELVSHNEECVWVEGAFVKLYHAGAGGCELKLLTH